MKRIIFLLIAIVLFSSCQQDEIIAENELCFTTWYSCNAVLHFNDNNVVEYTEEKTFWRGVYVIEDGIILIYKWHPPTEIGTLTLSGNIKGDLMILNGEIIFKQKQKQ